MTWHLSNVPGEGLQRAQASLVITDDGATALLFGGREARSAPCTQQLLALDMAAGAAAKWRPLAAASGKTPAPRWGATSFLYADHLWVFSGTATAGNKPCMSDVWRFSLAARAWTEVQQRGATPHRGWGGSANGWDRAARHGGFLLAFGEAKDENRNPAAGKRAAPGTIPLSLHALDLLGGTWAELRTSGAPGFEHLEALVVVGSRLVAVGWRAPRGGRKEDTPMQVATLDLSLVLRDSTAAAAWAQLPTHGQLPTPRTGCAAVLLPATGAGGGASLLMHGGALCTPAVQGLVTADAFLLDLDTCAWTKLAPSRADAGATDALPRANHCVAAVPGGKALILGGTSALGCHVPCPPMELLGRQPGPARTELQPSALLVPTLPPATGAGAGTVAPLAAAEERRHALAARHDLQSFFMSEALADVVLLVGNVSLPAHRLVLAAAPRFRELIDQAAAFSKPVGGKWKLHLADLYPDILKLLVAHLYGCLEGVPPADAATLFTAAARYGLPALRAECLRVLVAHTTVESAATHALLAAEQGCPELMQACVSFVAASKERFAQLLATPGYLHLTAASPKVGQLFLSQAMAQLLGRE